MIGFLKNAWRGQAKAWKVFWLLGFLLAIIMIIVTMFLIAPLAMVSPMLATVVSVVLLLAVMIFQTVSNWRCAFNCKAKFWGYIIRAIVILNVAQILFSIVITVMGFLLMPNKDEMAQMMQMQMQMQQEAQQNGFAPEAFSEDGFEAEGDMSMPMDDAADMIEAGMDSADAAPVDYAALCGEKFDSVYAEQGFDPVEYPEERASYVDACVKQVDPDAAAAVEPATDGVPATEMEVQ